MTYNNIEKIDFSEIEKFASAFGFPNNEKIKDIFYENNAGEPENFYFKILNNGKFEEKKLRKLLSFDKNSDENIYDAMNDVFSEKQNIIPFAIDNEDNYVCFVDDLFSQIMYYDTETMEIDEIYNENEEKYTEGLFFEDML